MSKSNKGPRHSKLLYRKLRDILLTVIELKQSELNGTWLGSQDIVDCLEYLDGLKLSSSWARVNCLKLAEQGKLVAFWSEADNGWRFSLPAYQNKTNV